MSSLLKINTVVAVFRLFYGSPIGYVDVVIELQKRLLNGLCRMSQSNESKYFGDAIFTVVFTLLVYKDSDFVVCIVNVPAVPCDITVI